MYEAANPGEMQLKSIHQSLGQKAQEAVKEDCNAPMFQMGGICPSENRNWVHRFLPGPL